MEHKHEEEKPCEGCEATQALVEEIYSILPDDKNITLAALSGVLALAIDDSTPTYRKNANQAKKVMQEAADYVFSILDGRNWGLK